MSDPVTNVEIEDVLSSIRRLVSVDPDRNIRKPVSDEAAQRVDGAKDRCPKPAAPEDKLVLTSDLRVKGERDAVMDRGTARTDTEALKRRIAELEAAVNAQANDFEPDGSEDTDQHRPKSIPSLSFRAQVEAEGQLSRLAPISDDGVMDIGALVQHEAEDNRAADTDTEDDAAVDDTDTFVRQQFHDADADALSSAGPFDPAPARADEDVSQQAAPDGAPVDQEHMDDRLMQHLVDAQGADALHRDRATEAAEAAEVLEDAPEYADAATWTDDARDETPEFAPEAAASPEILDAEQHRVHPFNNGGMDNDLRDRSDRGIDLTEDTVIDEEALREMVAEIVREELQGALGERITRNVRKLVRREIMRAISIRDFD